MQSCDSTLRSTDRPLRRILLLITDLEIGGTPSVVRELAIRLRQPGLVEVEVACLAPWGPIADELQKAGVNVTALNARGVRSVPIVFLRLVRLIRRGRFDTVFSFLIHANLMASLAVACCSSRFSGRRALVPPVSSPADERGTAGEDTGGTASRPSRMWRTCPGVRFLQSIQTTQPRPRWHWWVQRLIHRMAEAIVVPSPSVARASREWAGVPQERLVVIPNAVDTKSFDDVAASRRVPTEPFQIGFVGRLDPVKRVEDLVMSLEGLKPSKAHLHIFGDGVSRPAIESMVRSGDLSGQVTLHGSISRPREALSMIDSLVLPSDAEGFGLVLIEAMAAGVPVVATRVAGIQDVVEDGRTGLLVPPRNPPALRDAILKACCDRDWRQKSTRAARANVQHRFSWEVVLPQYQALLRITPSAIQPSALRLQPSS